MEKGGTWYRVCVGHFQKSQDARAFARRSGLKESTVIKTAYSNRIGDFASKQEIEQEIHRLAPLVEQGGFIGFCDHRVPPDVPLENYMFYLETVREVWGYNVDLKPMGEVVSA